jgi:hypothetical protein
MLGCSKVEHSFTGCQLLVFQCLKLGTDYLYVGKGGIVGAREGIILEGCRHVTAGL